MLCNQIIEFNAQLKITSKLPKGVTVLNPFKDVTTAYLSETFYKKYYNDTKPRYVVLGINPGRLGSGITGVPFTDPINLEKYCGIENNLPKKHELSSEFVYKTIEDFGGLEKFYSRFYITSVCPLGFTKNGKNINYYDDRNLQEKIEPFVIESLNQQLSWGLNRASAFIFGEGKNFTYFQKLNQQHGFFKSLMPLPHPRFIMQYKLKKLDEYIALYLRAFSVS
jgi:hypothetical protein